MINENINAKAVNVHVRIGRGTSTISYQINISIFDHGVKYIPYRLGFDCEILIIVNCKLF